MKKSLVILVIISAFFLFSCFNTKNNQPSENKDIVFDFRDSDIYIYLGGPQEYMKPSISLYKSDNSFRFMYSIHSSSIPAGKYELTDERLILRYADKIYTFDVVGDTFVFDADNSATMPRHRISGNSAETYTPVPDGAVFERINIAGLIKE